MIITKYENIIQRGGDSLMALERLFRPIQPPIDEAPNKGIGGGAPIIVFRADIGAGTGKPPVDTQPAGQAQSRPATKPAAPQHTQPPAWTEGLHETELGQTYNPADHFGSGY